MSRTGDTFFVKYVQIPANNKRFIIFSFTCFMNIHMIQAYTYYYVPSRCVIWMFCVLSVSFMHDSMTQILFVHIFTSDRIRSHLINISKSVSGFYFVRKGVTIMCLGFYSPKNWWPAPLKSDHVLKLRVNTFSLRATKFKHAFFLFPQNCLSVVAIYQTKIGMAAV